MWLYRTGMDWREQCTLRIETVKWSASVRRESVSGRPGRCKDTLIGSAHAPALELIPFTTSTMSRWGKKSYYFCTLMYYSHWSFFVSNLQVRISVKPSGCHADTLYLELISSKPHRTVQPESQPAGRGRSELVQEVVRWAEEASLQAEEKKGRKSKLSREERQFRQSKTPNLYVILQEISELALLDLSACQITNTEAQMCTTSS